MTALALSHRKETSIEANLAWALEEIARSDPERTAFIQGSGVRATEITYAQLAKAVAQRAGVLHRQGLRNGAAVIVLQPMSIELYTSILAVFRLGGRVLIIDAAAGRQIIEHAVNSNRPDAVIASGKGLIAAMSLRSIRRVKLKFTDGLTAPGWCSLNDLSAKPAPVQDIEPSHPALVTLTSGTSGKPKSIVRSHQFLKQQLHAFGSNCPTKPGDRELTALPVFALANLASRVTTVLPDTNLRKIDRLDVSAVINQLRVFRPDRILGSPIFVEKIVQSALRCKMQFPSVKAVVTGGGPVFPRLLQDASRVFPNAELVTVYGSSEAEPISKIKYAELSLKDLNAIAHGAGLPVGKPIDQIKIRINPLWNNDTELADANRLAMLRHICELSNLDVDAIGEIIVTGDHVVKGYAFGIGDEETKLRIAGEIWHRTGDIGYFDGQGRLWLTGRVKRELDTNFAQCVEAVALSDRSLNKAACVTLDNRTTLYVEPNADARSVDIWSLKDRLNWSNLTEVRLVHRIPMDTRHNSKVLYHKLT